MNKWNYRYFRLAQETASWSKDPNRKVGAVIIGDKGQIKSQGYYTPIDANPNWSETGKLALEMFAEAGIICEFVERT